MRLSDLLQFNDIVIQCHDNPDADALASGYAIWWFFKQNNKNARFIYRGRNKIQKSNLMIMLSELEIPVSYEPDFSDVPELLVLVDCQAGQRNVTDTPAQTIARSQVPCRNFPICVTRWAAAQRSAGIF